MPLRAILFDLDDTLTDDYECMETSVKAVASRLAERLGGIDTAQLVPAYWEESNAVWTEFAQEQLTGVKVVPGRIDTLRFESMRRTLEACGIEDTDLAHFAAEAYKQAREETLCLSQSARPVLHELRPRFRTGLITNGPKDHQWEKIRRFGLDELVDYCIVSEEFGLGKPNPAIFLHVAEKLGVQPAACLMVGDYIHLDVLGAHNAGMKGVWLNRRDEPLPEDGAQPDYIISDLREILQIVHNAADGN